MRRLLIPTLLLAAVPMLQACVPVVATGVGAGALMMDDRRTSGAYVEDEGIELKAANLIEDKFKDKVHVDATSYNRRLLLVGEVPTEEDKVEVEHLARGIANVAEVINELAIAQPSSFSERSNDGYITSKVKARMIDAKRFSANRVKVTTERGVVYLMGMVTPQEEEDAVEIARTTSDVKRVVKVFERWK